MIKRKQKGFTLIELMVYMAIFVIFIGGMVMYGIQAMGLKSKTRVEQEVISTSRNIMRRISLEIRNATAINTISAQSLSLATADATRNPVVITKTGTRITIGWGGGSVCAVATPCNLSSNDVSVDKLTFANMSDPGGASVGVKYDLTISRTGAAGGQEWSYTTTDIGSSEVMSK